MSLNASQLGPSRRASLPTHRVRVLGADVAVWWSSESETATEHVLLVHGAAAHHGWWDDVVPLLESYGWAVSYLDLSGHGESPWRERYDAHIWGAEVAEVARRLGATAVVAHSMGGLAALVGAAADPVAIQRLVMVDSLILDADQAVPPERIPSGRVPIYPTRDAAIQAFRLLPPQPFGDTGRLRRLAQQGVTCGPSGWIWRFDRRIFGSLDHADVRAAAPLVRAPIAYIYGAQSVLSSDVSVCRLARWLDKPIGSVAIPHAHHHVMLDQPVALSAALFNVIGEADTSAADLVDS